MSFERLIVCVDNSGSMRGRKIETAKKLLLEVDKAFACETKYFEFQKAPQEISLHEFKQLSGGHGTKIEYTLNRLFSKDFRKWAHYGKNTKFIFVTDADDNIEDAASCVSAKKRCVKAFGGKLDCECVLTGRRGGDGCLAELKIIFGDNAFHHCSNKNFKSVLQSICGGIKKANNIAQTVLPGLSREIQNLANSEEKETQQIGEDMQEIVNKVRDIATKTAEAKQTIAETRRNLQTLNSQKSSIVNRADAAQTDEEMESAEAALEAATTEYRSQYKPLNKAGEKLDEAQQGLDTESKKADKMAEKLSKKSDEISKAASRITSNIIRTIKDLSDITSGAYQQVKHLKGEFNKQLSDLLNVVSENETTMKEFENVKDKIIQSFKDLRSRRTELSDFKKEIVKGIEDLNAALQRLDDRFLNAALQRPDF